MGELLQNTGEAYRTIRKDMLVVSELVEKKSRFIAHLRHVESEAQADAFLEEIRSQNRDARHNVPAWILADGRERTSDDGEPSRAAGMPVLDVLRGAGLKDVCCVVTRYFGGTLLGTGGLVRAYSGACAQALEQAQEDGAICLMSPVVTAVVDMPYSLYERVSRMISDANGKVRDSLFAEDVQLTCTFLAGQEAPFVDAMHELVAGEELVRVGEVFFGEF